MFCNYEIGKFTNVNETCEYTLTNKFEMAKRRFKICSWGSNFEEFDISMMQFSKRLKSIEVDPFPMSCTLTVRYIILHFVFVSFPHNVRSHKRLSAQTNGKIQINKRKSSLLAMWSSKSAIRCVSIANVQWRNCFCIELQSDY